MYKNCSVFTHYIAWNPGTSHVALVQKSESPTMHGKYLYFWGISDLVIEKLTEADHTKLVLAQALHLIVTHRCDPYAVHQVLLELEEYADGWADLFTLHQK